MLIWSLLEKSQFTKSIGNIFFDGKIVAILPDAITGKYHELVPFLQDGRADVR